MSNEEAFELALKHFNLFHTDSDQIVCFINAYTFDTVTSKGFKNIWVKQKLEWLESSKQKNVDEFFYDQPHKQFIHNNLKKIIEKRIVLTALGINFLRTKEYVAMLFHYLPLINPFTKDVIAVHVTGTKIDYPIGFFRLSKLITIFNTSMEQLDDHKRLQNYDAIINVYEHEILFLMFYFNTYNDIAEVLSIRYNFKINGNTIAKYVRTNLYSKFKVISISELKSIAIQKNYHKKIPLSLMSPMIIDLSEL